MKKVLLTILAVACLTLPIMGQKKKKPLPVPVEVKYVTPKEEVTQLPIIEELPEIHSAPTRPTESQTNSYSNNKILTEYDMVIGEQFKTVTPVELDKDAMIIYDYDGSLKSFNLKTNTINWTFKAKDNDVTYSRNKFTLEDGVLYVPFINGEMYAIDHKTGEKFWELKAGLKNSQYFKIWINQIPTINKDLIYITTQYENSNIYAFNKKKGQIVRNYKLVYPYNHLPVVYANDRVYTQNAPYVYAFDANTGREIARRDFKKAMYSKPISDGQRLYIANESKTLYALNLDNLETIWEVDLPESSVDQRIVVKGNTLYLTTDHTFYAIESSSGKIIWQVKPKQDYNHSIQQLEEYNNKLYAYDNGSNFFVLNPKNGKIETEIALSNKPISNIEVQDQNTVFFYCEAGLIRLELSSKKEELIYMRNSINEDARENYIKLIR